MTHSRLPVYSLFFIFDRASARGSRSIMGPHSYFLKPISTATSLKQCLHIYKPYRLMMGPWEPHLLQVLVPFPTFVLGIFPPPSKEVGCPFRSTASKAFLRNSSALVFLRVTLQAMGVPFLTPKEGLG